MSDLGDLLRKAREQRGLTLDDIQDLTKIRKRYLEAIEEGNYNLLPGSFYVRAFVKNYAENVGLDAEEVLRLYQKEIPSAAPAPEQVVETVQRPRRARTQTSDRWSRWGFRALIWCFLLLIAVLVYVFAINRPGNGDLNSADQTQMTDQSTPPDTGGSATEGTGGGATPTPSAPPTPTPTPTLPVTTLTLQETKGGTDYYNISPGGTHTIEFKVSGRVWIGVNPANKSGSYLLQKTLNDGETASVDVQDDVLISTAHANLTNLTIDGVTVDMGDKIGTKKIRLVFADDTADSGDGA